MLVLGIDSSAVSASCAICELGETQKVIASSKINNKVTHSQTLIPIMEAMLKNSQTALSDIDLFAVAAGPGSFTGLRIGISAIKGMAFALNKNVKSVSTLEALAYNLAGIDCVACAVMDARCNQFYNAMFSIKHGKITRLCGDRAVMIDELQSELEKYDERVILVGDGAELAKKKITLPNIEIAPASLCYQSAESVCFASENYDEINATQLMPVYLRLPQAERERLAKNNA